MDSIDRDPWGLFDEWIAAAKDLEQYDAMALATSSLSSEPSVRFVLFKGRENDRIFFFTNYESRKAQELETNPKASISFYWAKFDRQLRMSGRVVRTTPEHSDQYFRSRPRLSQVGARASMQGKTLGSRQEFLDRITKEEETWGKNKVIPRPEFWGGYAIIPHVMEFWQGHENRLHDRQIFELEDGRWVSRKLYP